MERTGHRCSSASRAHAGPQFTPTLGGVEVNTSCVSGNNRRLSPTRIGIVWWRWSALVAFGVSDIEVLFLILVAFALDQFEFAWVAAPFVAFAFVAALTADPLMILTWLFLPRHITALRTHRSWLVLFVLILCIPLLMAPRSWYEAAIAAPAVLGFPLPRLLVPQLAIIPERT